MSPSLSLSSPPQALDTRVRCYPIQLDVQVSVQLADLLYALRELVHPPRQSLEKITLDLRLSHHHRLPRLPAHLQVAVSALRLRSQPSRGHLLIGTGGTVARTTTTSSSISCYGSGAFAVEEYRLRVSGAPSATTAAGATSATGTTAFAGSLRIERRPGGAWSQSRMALPLVMRACHCSTATATTTATTTATSTCTTCSATTATVTTRTRASTHSAKAAATTT